MIISYGIYKNMKQALGWSHPGEEPGVCHSKTPSFSSWFPSHWCPQTPETSSLTNRSYFSHPKPLDPSTQIPDPWLYVLTIVPLYPTLQPLNPSIKSLTSQTPTAIPHISVVWHLKYKIIHILAMSPYPQDPWPCSSAPQSHALLLPAPSIGEDGLNTSSMGAHTHWPHSLDLRSFKHQNPVSSCNTGSKIPKPAGEFPVNCLSV